MITVDHRQYQKAGCETIRMSAHIPLAAANFRTPLK
jgi:hypothetical protein